MTNVLIMSDTHQNQLLLRKVLQREISDCEYVFHLGDNYEDLDENEDLLTDKRVVKVPGIFHRRYLDGTLPATEKVRIKGWSFLLVHNIDDIPDIRPDHNVFLFGHTHRMEYAKKDRQHYINPGHLKNVLDKHRPASYALMKVEIDRIQLLFKDKDGNPAGQHLIDRYE